MHYPKTDIQAEIEINRPIRYQIIILQTDGQTSRTTTIGSLFKKEKKILKMGTSLASFNPDGNNPDLSDSLII